MSPLLKNALLAFAAGFVTSLAAFLEFADGTDVPALKAAGLAALYAGGRALVGFLKEKLSGQPFAVDTEDPTVDAIGDGE